MVPSRVQGLIDMGDMQVLRDHHNRGRLMEDECLRALMIVTSFHYGVEDSGEDRSGPMIKPNLKK